jgi:hypothetical protein
VVVELKVLFILAEPVIGDGRLRHVDLPDHEQLGEELKDGFTGKRIAAIEGEDDTLVDKLMMVVRHAGVLQALEELTQVLRVHVSESNSRAHVSRADVRDNASKEGSQRHPQIAYSLIMSTKALVRASDVSFRE